MIYNFDALPARRSTESAKWRIYPEDVLPMWVADMDFLSPEPVIRALKQRVEHGVFGYPMLPDEFTSVIVERMKKQYQWQIQPEDLVFIPGVVTGLNLACQAYSAPGEGVLVQPPVYPPFLGAPGTAGAVRQEAELVQISTGPKAGSYEVDWQTFEAAITPQTRLFLLCNPHNPVGRVFQRSELEQISEICLRHGLVICSDEIHGELVFSGQQHIPIASLSPEIGQKTITLIAPSKTFNLAGLECSIAIISNPNLRQQFKQARKGLVPGVNLMGMVAGLIAYQEGQEWLDQLLIYLEANREFLVSFVQNELPGIHITRPEGTYLAWLDCRDVNLEGGPYEFFLKHAKVAMNDGKTFGRKGEGFVRLNFGCPRSVLQEALERMRNALVNPE